MNLLQLTIEEVDLPRILELRTSVLRPHFSPPQQAHFPGDEDDTTHHFAALTPDGQVLAVISYYQSELDGQPAVQLRGMAVDPDHQRLGIGAHLLTTTLARLPLLYPTAHWLWCNARQKALSFYHSHFFKPFGDTFELPSIGLHQPMKRPLPTAIAS